MSFATQLRQWLLIGDDRLKHLSKTTGCSQKALKMYRDGCVCPNSVILRIKANMGRVQQYENELETLQAKYGLL